MSVVLVGLPVPPVAPPDPFVGLRMTWTGWDGSVWELATRDGVSGVSMAPGLRGLETPPPHRRLSKSSPALPGSRHTGTQVLDKGIWWPIRVYSDVSSSDWLAVDSAFWSTMDEDRPGVWTVYLPDGSSRSLVCRFAGVDESGTDIDPLVVGWNLYGINLVAEEPYWRGAPVVVTRDAAEPPPFFPPAGGPPFNIARSTSVGTAAIGNRGDRTGWLDWWVAGPQESGEYGVDGRVIEVPFEIDEGRLLVVDSSPTGRIALEVAVPATLEVPGAGPQPFLEVPDEIARAFVASQLATGLDRTKELGPATKFGAVAARSTSALHVEMEGTGWVRAYLVPQHRRAW